MPPGEKLKVILKDSLEILFYIERKCHIIWTSEIWFLLNHSISSEIKKCGAGVRAQRVKLAPVMAANNMGAGSNPGSSFTDPTACKGALESTGG